jgi:hypothetical protein
MDNKVLDQSDPLLVNEWDSDTFHRRVIELEASGYVARQESYHILPEMNPETGEIIHLHTIEMEKPGPIESGKQ